MAIETQPSKTFFLVPASQVFRKIMTGITGLLLILYLAQHLFANLKVFGSDPLAVSKYGYKLKGLGLLLTVAEILLGALIIYHVVMGIAIWFRKRRSRPIAYKRYESKGAPSRQTWASRTMIWGGLLLLVFLVLHVAYFRFGPGVAEGYAATIDGNQVKHFEALVLDRFQHFGYVIFYSLALLALGFHLSHGFWSAMVSLGLVTEKNRDWLYSVGVVLATVLTIGFMVIPLRIYFAG